MGCKFCKCCWADDACESDIEASSCHSGFDYESNERTPLTTKKYSDIGSDMSMSDECRFDDAKYKIAYGRNNEIGYGMEE